MKTYNGSSFTKTFGTLVLLAILLFIAFNTEGQPTMDKNIFNALPVHLSLPSNPQRYRITTDYYNRTFQGVFIDKIRVSGDFTTNLPDNTEKWNNVSIAKSQLPDGEFSSAEPQLYIENFTYKPSGKILEPEFFKDFPFEAVHVKNLVWDMAGIEAFAWMHLDSLKLNKLYEAKQMNGAANLAGLGTFTNNNIQLIWKGVSMINNQFCGLIDFRAMDNPLACDIKMGEKNLILKGTSHYWGTVYISLTKKVMEYAELMEIVTMQMNWSDQPSPQYVYTTRFMKVEKNK